MMGVLGQLVLLPVSISSWVDATGDSTVGYIEWTMPSWQSDQHLLFQLRTQGLSNTVIDEMIWLILHRIWQSYLEEINGKQSRQIQFISFIWQHVMHYRIHILDFRTQLQSLSDITMGRAVAHARGRVVPL